MGDVISLAGKVAVETAFPGSTVKWRFGRVACNHEAVAEKELAPPPTISTIAEMQPFLDRYALTADEMALLTSGAHAITGSKNFQVDTGIVDFDFTQSNVTSGLQFIKDSQDLTKMQTFFGDWFGFFGSPSFGRFPSDMLFFPATVAKIRGATADPTAASTETFLNSFQTESSFNTEFAAVFSKMLEIGVATNTLVDFN